MPQRLLPTLWVFLARLLCQLRRHRLFWLDREDARRPWRERTHLLVCVECHRWGNELQRRLVLRYLAKQRQPRPTGRT